MKKKIGTFFLATVPFILGMGIQFFIVYYLLIVAAIFLFAIAPILTGDVASINDLMELAADMNFNTIIMICFSVTCSVIFALWYYKSCGGNFKPDFKKNFHPLELAGIVLLVPGSQFLSNLVASLVAVAFPSWLEEYEALLENAGLVGEVPLLMMLYSVILAPISEELLFRGVTLRIARRAFPFWFANLFQAFLFGAFHMNMLQGCYTFVLGLILGFICEKGGTLYHVIIFHILFNLWGTTASEWLTALPETVQGMLIIFGCVFFLAGGFALFVMGNQKKRTIQM